MSLPLLDFLPECHYGSDIVFPPEQPMSTVGAREANRSFSKILREAESGRTVTITRNGKPVARLVPAPVPAGVESMSEEERKAAKAQLMALLDKGLHLGGRGFTRDEMNER